MTAAFGEALERFAAHDAGKAELVELRSFSRLNNAQTARVLGVSGFSFQRLLPVQDKRQN